MKALFNKKRPGGNEPGLYRTMTQEVLRHSKKLEEGTTNLPIKKAKIWVSAIRETFRKGGFPPCF